MKRRSRSRSIKDWSPPRDHSVPDPYSHRDHLEAYGKACAEIREIPDDLRTQLAEDILADIRWWEAHRCGFQVNSLTLEAFTIYRWFFRLHEADRYQLVRDSRHFRETRKATTCRRVGRSYLSPWLNGSHE
jgi:hypothetical protein